MKKGFVRLALRVGILVTMVCAPSVYNVLATTPAIPFVRYSIRGNVYDSAGAPMSGVVVTMVGKGPYSLDSALAVVRLQPIFDDDYSSVYAADGVFSLRVSMSSSSLQPDSIGVMIEDPRVFGTFISLHDSTTIPATEKYIDYQNSGGCSCSPTATHGVYNGREYVVTGYQVRGN